MTMASGGKREGSGRKAFIPGEIREQLSISVSPATKARLADLRKQGVATGKLIDELVRKFCDNPEND